MKSKYLSWLTIILIILWLTGCSQKTVGSSESSAKILNNYVKKPVPSGWYWNFGIGSNYTNALMDADKALSFNSPASIKTNVLTVGGTHFKNGEPVYSQPTKLVSVESYNVFTSKAYCEVKEAYDVPEGIMLIRVCPDLNFFNSEFPKNEPSDEQIKKDVKFSFVIGKVLQTINNRLNNVKIGNDFHYLYAFKYEVTEMDRGIWNNNFSDMDHDEIIFWLDTEYKKWFNTLGSFKNSSLKQYYGIMYPYMYYKDVIFKKMTLPNQYWKLVETGSIISRKYKLSEVQLLGITNKPETSLFEYIESKGRL